MFLILTDHYSLKFLLDQSLSTIPQHQWVSKLFGYDFSAEYRPGKKNTAADALSRRDEESSMLHNFSAPHFPWYDQLRLEMYADPTLVALHDRVRAG